MISFGNKASACVIRLRWVVPKWDWVVTHCQVFLEFGHSTYRGNAMPRCRDRRRGECCVTSRGRDWSMVSLSRGVPRVVASRRPHQKREDSPLGPSRRSVAQPPPPLDFRLLASKRWENKLCCFKSPEFVVLDYGSPGKLIQDSALACGGGGVDTAAGCLQDLEDGASAWPVTIPEQRLSCPLSLCCLHVVWKRTCPFFLKIFCLLDRLRSQVGR